MDCLFQRHCVPAYNNLIGHYKVTVGVVRQSMQILQHEGLIHSVPRVGSVVANQPVRRRHIGYMLLGHEDAAMQMELIYQFNADLDHMHYDLLLRPMKTTDEAALAAARDWVNGLDGVLLTGRVTVKAARAIMDFGIPVVLVGEPRDAPIPTEICAVTIDVPSIVHLAMSHLTSLGHTRILFDNGSHTRYYQLLSEAFAQATEDYGIVSDCQLHPLQDERLPAVDFVKNVVLMQPAPTAILVEGLSRARRVVELLSIMGKTVPDAISVIAISGTTPGDRMNQRLTCILSSTRELTLRAVEMIDNMLTASESQSMPPPVRVERCVPSFVPGYSCRSIR